MQTRRVPRLRHHAARRCPARGNHATRWPTSSRWPACSTRSASGSSRAAGRARCPRTPSSSPVPPTVNSRCRHAMLVAFGATRKAGVKVEDDPQVRALLESPGAGGHAGREVRRRGTSSGPCAPRWRRTSRWCATRCAFLRAEGRRVFLDCEHFFDGYQHDRDYGVRGARCRGERRRRRRGPVRHERRHAADGRARRRHRTCAVAPASGSASTPRTTRVARWPTPWPPWMPARRTSRAPPTATASGPATRTSSASSAVWSPRWASTCCPTGCLGRDGARLARDRRDREPRAGHARAVRGCVRVRAQGRPARVARSRSSRSCTTTSTRRSSATTSASWSPRWPAARRSS